MDFVALKKTRAYLLGGAAVAALSIGAGTVWAQTADTSGELETVVVSSTRLQNAGFDAPIQLPSLQGSTGQTYQVGSTSTGLQGLSSFSQRGFSPLRTLTLIDGE